MIIVESAIFGGFISINVSVVSLSSTLTYFYNCLHLRNYFHPPVPLELAFEIDLFLSVSVCACVCGAQSSRCPTC